MPYRSWRARFTLRLQLTLWIVIVFTLIQWIASATYWVFQRASINHAFDARFVGQSQMVSAELAPTIPVVTRDALDERQTLQLRQTQFQAYSIDLFDADGNRLVEPGYAEVDPVSLPLGEAIESGVPITVADPQWLSLPDGLDPSRMRAALVPVDGADGLPYLLFQATSDQYAHDQILLMSQVLLIYALIAPALGLIGGWFISGIATAPFLRIQRAIANLSPGSLHDPVSMPESSHEIAELTAQLDETREQIRQAFASQERFISNVSHEIKTPIAVMQIEAETLDLSGANEDVKIFVGSVHEEMSRLGKLVESFLTLTRIKDGVGETHEIRYGVNDMVMDSIDHCESMGQQQGVELRPILLGDEETVDTAVRGNPELLVTMLDNLIRNAIRYSPSGGIVECELVIDEDKVRILVRDEGPGIPTERLGHVFDRFAQVQGKERQGRGHGLGLAIAKGIAELHRGSISVANNPTSGCTFTIILPVESRS